MKTDTYLSNPETYISLIDPKGFMWLIGKFEESYNTMMTKNKKYNLLEIGAGVGYFMILAFARGWNAKGVEISQSSAEWAKKYLRMDVENTTIEEFEDKKKYDAFVMIETLEHFLDAELALKSIKNLADSKALLFGTTPNTDSAFWQKKDIFVPDDHIFLFNPKSIKYLFDKLGFKNLELEFFGGDKGDAHLMFSVIVKN